MTERSLPSAVNGVEMRLDALIQGIDRLCDLLTPVALDPIQTHDGETVQLREPEATATPKPASRPKAR